MKKILIVCTTDSMIWNFLVPHISALQKAGFLVECACSETGFYYNELVSKNCLILHKIPFERSPFKISNIKSFRLLNNLIKQQNYDYIYCHEPVGGAMGRLAGKANNKYVMYIAHGFHFFQGAPLKHWILYYFFEWFLSFFTDTIVTICKEDYNHAKKLHARKVYYIPGIGVDFNKYEIDVSQEEKVNFRDSAGIDTDDIVIATVGEISIRKNHKIIIESLKKIDNKKLHLVICGEGEQQENLQKLITSYNLKDNVHFLGFRRDIEKVLKCCDFFVFPSLWEGLGLAGIEAMYSGLPVIGANRQGIKDYVIEGKSGYLFDPSDSEQLASCITKMTNLKSDTFTDMKVYGKNIVLKYKMENSINTLLEIFEKENIRS